MDYSLPHFVPQFYLRRFAGVDGKIWVYDKATDQTFPCNPKNLAGEHRLYTLPDAVGDPSQLEKWFAGIEDEAASITSSWISQLTSSEEVGIAGDERKAMSLYLTLQLFRTPEARTLLLQGLESHCPSPSAAAIQALHLSLLLDDDLIIKTANIVDSFAWGFARNISENSLWTSDDPIRVRSLRQHRCLTWAQIDEDGAYLAYPLTPRWILYCYDRRLFPKGTERFENRVSPVPLSSGLVDAENIPHVGHAQRFVFADQRDFTRAKEFCELHPILRERDRNRFDS